MRKKLFVKIFILILFYMNLSSQELSFPNLHISMMENGLTVYVMEDSTDALVRVEFACRCGFSCQNQDNAGFFKLYSNIIAAANPQLEFSMVECNADSTRFVLTSTPSKLSQNLENLASAVFSLFYTDELLSEQLALMKNQVTENSESLAGFINSAIDSRVFAGEPWKNDSGIYPAIFKNYSVNEARKILKEISDAWYTPQNSAIFISGNVKQEKIAVMLKNSFGKYYSAYNPPVKNTIKTSQNNLQKKYVLHHPDFSPELTQVVVQYTFLEMDQCNLLSAALNTKDSKFKTTVLSNENLNIPGDEYINIAGAHKTDSNRLIFQTLIQPVQTQNLIQSSSALQVEEFLSIVTKASENLSTKDLVQAQIQLESDIKQITSTTQGAMDYCSQMWAIKPYLQDSDCSLSKIDSIYTSEQPFVFVIINSQDYKNNKQLYDAAGYEEITTKNASWYSQKMYENIQDYFKPQDELYYNQRTADNFDNNYVEKNKSEITKVTLKNGINVVTKKNDFSDYLTIMLSIKGGKINSANNNGFEEAMVNILSAMIQNEIAVKQSQNIIFGNPSVTAKTELSTSTISIDCLTDDFVAVCNAISSAIIYGTVKPAIADRAVSSRQYRKRLENGSVVNQLMDKAMETLYGKNEFSAIFDSEADILLDTTYTSILEAYPAFLDACRYSIILCGNISNNYKEILDSTLGMLVPNNLNVTTPELKMDFPHNKSLKVKVKHTFLTDIPAEEAGPMPSVLIPTTEFLDPVMYVYKTPEPGTKEAVLFNALINYLDWNIPEDTILQLPKYGIPAVFLTFQNVEKKKMADLLLSRIIYNVKESIEAPYTNKAVVQEIKDVWLIWQMGTTSTNAGTAELIHKGFELYPENPDPAFYLSEYEIIQNATAQDFQSVFDYLLEDPAFCLYSEYTK